MGAGGRAFALCIFSLLSAFLCAKREAKLGKRTEIRARKVGGLKLYSAVNISVMSFKRYVCLLFYVYSIALIVKKNSQLTSTPTSRPRS